MRKIEIRVYALAAVFGVLVAVFPELNGVDEAAEAVEPPAALAIQPAGSGLLQAVQYKIDASQSRFSVKAFAGGLLSAFAHDHNIAIRDFGGVAGFTYGTVSPASLQLTIKAESLAVTDKVKDKDRQSIEKTMREDVLAVGTYPAIVFKSTKVEASQTGEGQFQAKIWGDLTLHGVTKSQMITAQLSFGQDSLRAQGTFPLKQSDYGIKPVSVAGGTIKVKDGLRCTFDIAAHP